jgi:hypothetical protein
MSGELSQIALEFARRCKGWQHPIYEADGLVFKTIPGKELWPESFSPSDLNAVMEAARAFCEANRLILELDYCPFDAFADFKVLLRPSAERRFPFFRSRNLCHALMAACVEAAKRLEVA